VSPPRGLPTGPRTPVLRPTPPRGPRHCSVAGHRPGHRGALCGARGPARAVCPLGGRPAAVRAVCKDLGAGVEVVVTDVLDDAQVERAVVAALARFGRLDVCVHVAGVSAYGHHTGTTADVFARVVSINLVGARTSGRVPRPRCGALVVVGSVLGGVAVPGMGAYVASKWGGLRVLQQENRDLAGVRVTSVAPGSVRTSIYSSAVGGSDHGATPPPPSTSSDGGPHDRPRRPMQTPRERRRRLRRPRQQGAGHCVHCGAGCVRPACRTPHAHPDIPTARPGVDSGQLAGGGPR